MAAPSDPVVGRFSGGVVTQSEVVEEVRQMPPALRKEFSSAAGERELVSSMVDKRLLFEEAQRRGLQKDPDIEREVQELQERLMIRALLAQEEKRAGPISEQELRQYFQANPKEFITPEKVQIERLLIAVPATASKSDRAKAREKTERLLAQAKRGVALAKLAASVEGGAAKTEVMEPFAKTDSHDPKLVEAAFALKDAGALSSVLELNGGFAVLRLVARQPESPLPFEAVRSKIETKLDPAHRRHVFNELLEKLRKPAEVHVDLATRK
ncbi:MAG: peptidyl-prolyl cis-trans isomerase [Deltaproteobacteria bacterium]|nr:peptidyl-prolyl cis-trans isomerase [Deltaproteobacteria bacterium]